MTNDISPGLEQVNARSVLGRPGKSTATAATENISSPRPRDFRESDFETLFKLDQECFPAGIAYSRNELMHYLSRPRAIALVAESVQGNICGFVVAESGRAAANGSSAVRACAGHIITIDVSAPARRAGLGSRLMDAIESRLRAADCDRIYLEVAVDNLSAIAFYKRRGYVVVKTLPRYYDRVLDGLRMEKRLE
ncbi:MAG: N-acetyltransferase [Terriglobales bacterium]|jgi:ribosomal protein S18 acetylase RimI-like enzyme